MVSAGEYWTGYVSVGQRRGTTNFNVSLENSRNKGVIFGLDGYTRQNFRVNLDQQLRSNLDASFSTFYGTSTNGRSAEGTASPFFGLMFVQPDVNLQACCNPDGSPYVAKVPLSGSTRLRWRLVNWLSAEGNFAYDQEAQDYSDVTPFGFLSSSGTPTDGGLVQRSLNDWQYNTGATLTSVRRFGNITNTSKVGM